MKIILTVNKPKSIFHGWTGSITMPNGEKIALRKYCGAAPVSFDTKEQLVKEAKRVAHLHCRVAPPVNA